MIRRDALGSPRYFHQEEPAVSLWWLIGAPLFYVVMTFGGFLGMGEDNVCSDDQIRTIAIDHVPVLRGTSEEQGLVLHFQWIG
jgi:hypothetical protein